MDILVFIGQDWESLTLVNCPTKVEAQFTVRGLERFFLVNAAIAQQFSLKPLMVPSWSPNREGVNSIAPPLQGGVTLGDVVG